MSNVKEWRNWDVPHHAEVTSQRIMQMHHISHFLYFIPHQTVRYGGCRGSDRVEELVESDQRPMLFGANLRGAEVNLGPMPMTS
jgi:hypothetical protein